MIVLPRYRQSCKIGGVTGLMISTERSDSCHESVFVQTHNSSDIILSDPLYANKYHPGRKSAFLQFSKISSNLFEKSIELKFGLTAGPLKEINMATGLCESLTRALFNSLPDY